ncbi:MAG: peptidase S8, partial [Chloroflexota bacterium]|nr:peptidase S8 [Chloroflexota bacterium]
MPTPRRQKSARLCLAFVMALLAIPLLPPSSAYVQCDSYTFPETGKTVRGKFLTYWNEHGVLPQQGYPISEEMQEKSDTDGKTYTVQYFERAVFELHPENAAPNDVLLSLLGNFLYKQKYPNGAPAQKANTSSGSQLFQQTGKRVGGLFLDYWQKHGGLA